VEVADGVSEQGISSLTIIFDTDTRYSLYNKQKQQVLNSILKG